jgi:cytochrome P450 PksS
MATVLKARDLASPEFKANPYPFYARMRQEAPVFQIGSVVVNAWLVTRYDDAVALFKDPRVSMNVSARLPYIPRFASPILDHMLNRDPPDHTRLRSLVSQAFTPRRIEALRGRVQAVCDDLLAAARPDQPFDLVRDYALPVPLTVISDMLGIPPADRRRFHTLTRGALSIGAPTRVTDVVSALPYLWLVMRYFRKLFAERRARPGEDLVSALVQAEDAGDRLTERELMGMSLLLLLAGYETTINLIASGALALLEHPAQRARFVADPSLAAPAVEEVLRFTSPLEMTPPRMAREDLTIGPATIRRGELLSVVVGSANRDESQFREPETFDIARDPNRHLSFGQGIHFCLGAPLARMEGAIALTTLFRRFPGLRLAQPASTLRWRRLLPLRGLEALPVVVA